MVQPGLVNSTSNSNPSSINKGFSNHERDLNLSSQSVHVVAEDNKPSSSKSRPSNSTSEPKAKVNVTWTSKETTKLIEIVGDWQAFKRDRAFWKNRAIKFNEFFKTNKTGLECSLHWQSLGGNQSRRLSSSIPAPQPNSRNIWTSEKVEKLMQLAAFHTSLKGVHKINWECVLAGMEDKNLSKEVCRCKWKLVNEQRQKGAEALTIHSYSGSLIPSDANPPPPNPNPSSTTGISKASHPQSMN